MTWWSENCDQADQIYNARSLVLPTGLPCYGNSCIFEDFEAYGDDPDSENGECVDEQFWAIAQGFAEPPEEK